MKIEELPNGKIKITSSRIWGEPKVKISLREYEYLLNNSVQKKYDECLELMMKYPSPRLPLSLKIFIENLISENGYLKGENCALKNIIEEKEKEISMWKSHIELNIKEGNFKDIKND